MDASSFQALLPEILLLIAACAILLCDLGVHSAERRLTYNLSLLSLVGLTLLFGWRAFDGMHLDAFNGMVLIDPLSNVFKAMAALSCAMVLVYSRTYLYTRGMLTHGGEFFVLLLLAFLGMCTVISGSNLLIIYLGIELLTLSSYALVALRRDDPLASEAAMKYFVLGAMASGFLLYGMSMFYGATGSLNLSTIVVEITRARVDDEVLILGLVFLVSGIAFKFGAAPFHMWVPDVYQGAPTVLTLLIGSAPKFVALAIVFRLLLEGLQPLWLDWQQMLVVLAVASLIVGNVAAIAQTNIKRMLAYSTIGQMGFVFLGLAAGGFLRSGTPVFSLEAYSAGMFYVVAYVLATLASFGVILLLVRQDFECQEISDLAGLNQRSPLLAAAMGASMFSLAGIPMFVGFYAKLFVLQALLQIGGVFYLALAVFAVIMSLIATFYYLRVVKAMYFDASAEGGQNEPVHTSVEAKCLLCFNGILIVWLGVFPSSLLDLSTQTLRASLTL